MDELRLKVKTLEAKLSDDGKPIENSTADAILSHARGLFDELMSTPNDRLKAVLMKLVHRIELNFKEVPWGKRRTRVATGCNVHLYADFSFTRVDRGDRTPIELFGRSLENLSEVFHHLY